MKRMLRDPHKFEDVITELKEGREVSFLVNGWSMLPFFYHNATLVTLKQGHFDIGDIVLYVDRKVSLNRIVNKIGDQYILRGDGQYNHYAYVCGEAILGKVVAFQHQDQNHLVSNPKVQRRMKQWLLVKKLPGSRKYIHFLRKKYSRLD